MILAGVNVSLVNEVIAEFEFTLDKIYRQYIVTLVNLINNNCLFS